MSVKENLLKLAILYRTEQFNAHQFHHLIQGETFFSDHSFLGELYLKYEEGFDDLCERLIGLGHKPDLARVTQKAASAVAPVCTCPCECFKTLLKGEKEIQGLIEESVKMSSQGTANLLAGLADESEIRTYKISRRVASAD